MKVALVLGAGASRGVSYAREREVPSPLDRDFFDLLQRFDADPKDKVWVDQTLRWVQQLPDEYWRSMERSFYTLHLKAYLLRKLNKTPQGRGEAKDDAEVVSTFVNAIGALLRSAHGTSTCEHHRDLLKRLFHTDVVLSFNYDLVIERALKALPRFSSVPFGDWLYGFSKRPKRWLGPVIYKLHGSFNWTMPEERDGCFGVRTRGWPALESAPGFTRFKKLGTSYPIFLPFWDKQIEAGPWRQVWLQALDRLTACDSVIVWGYSLPPTDVKAQLIFQHALKDRVINLCVIDPSASVRDRWRAMFPNARFWEFDAVDRFLSSPPRWWRDHPDNEAEEE
jgi:hypothetical protein